MTINIYLLSASDRFNYGDLLFPIVAKHKLSKIGDFKFHNIAIIDSDLSYSGALPTKNYKSLLDYNNIPSNSTLIIAGGQVLNANWSRLISYLTPFYNYIYRRFSGDSLEKVAKYLFGKNETPYSFMPTSKKSLEHYKIIYHAVGGLGSHNLPFQKEISQSFQASKYFSVRENKTYAEIKKNYDIDVTLVPDSVLVLSDIISKASLDRPIDEEYVCVQFGFQKSKAKLPVILSELKKIHEEHKLVIGLLSIGNCPGHDDIKSAEWIRANADFPTTILPNSKINDITRAIANAEIFIGTSLHGLIVSMSYNNPFVAVNKRIAKIEAYTETWAPDYLKGVVDFTEIALSVEQRLARHTGYNDILIKQKLMINASFERIAKIATSL